MPLTWPILVGVAALHLAGVAEGALAQRASVEGYQFQQLTDNDQYDGTARVSSAGHVVWVGQHNLPGAVSQGNDQEIYLWDGLVTQQVTDNDEDDTRPVVNSSGDIAWQRPGTDSDSEIFVRYGGLVQQLTQDSPAVWDRYPDINDAGIVVWGRSDAPPDVFDWMSFRVAMYDPAAGPGFTLFQQAPAYRPRINNQGLITATTADWILDTTGAVVEFIPQNGFIRVAKAALGDAGPLVAVGKRSQPPIWNIVQWDGTSLDIIFSSTSETLFNNNPPVSRPDVNAAGVVAFEAVGGLPGSVSGPDDYEIFVLDPDRGLIQLTDDDLVDHWPSVLADGRIVWDGKGGYGAFLSGPDDYEVFIATPVAACEDGIDNDSDGLVDHPDDPGCGSTASDNESPQCQDGLDNDGQLGTDFDGGVSAGAAADPNGADPDCTFSWDDREASGPSCGLGPELAVLLPMLAAWYRRRWRPKA